MVDFSISNDSIGFLKNKFRQYYKKNEVELPERFGKREFAFVLFEGRGMFRHLSFNKRVLFKNFLIDKVPVHIYYSSAYYNKPDAPTMNEKKWMGAELIFDLDSDHIPGAENLDYNNQLKMIKDEFYKLVFDFLLNDFGFNEKYIDINFSGSRGYHCHVKDPNIFCLDSSERREIVDYITGRDINHSLIFHDEATGKKDYGGMIYPSGKSLKMPNPSETGWKGRISRGIIDLVDEIKRSDDPIDKLKKYGIKITDAKKLVNDLSEERIRRIKEGNLDQSRAIRKFFLNSALIKTAVTIGAGETDEPVTCDIKRLIRLPLSLHGKTGLKASNIDINDFKTFDPLINSIAFSDDPIKIYLNKGFSIKINNEQFNLNPGEIEVPEYLAVFLIGRKIANII